MISEEKKEILLIGAGEFCMSALDMLEATAWTPAGIIDNNPTLRQVLGVPVLGAESRLAVLRERCPVAMITLDYSASSRIRRFLFECLQDLGYEVPTIISPLAHVSSHAQVGPGCIIMPHVVVTAGAKIGKNTLVDTNALIMADAEIGDHCFLGADSLVGAGVHAGNGARVNCGAKIADHMNLGKKCVIDIGVNITEDVPPYKIIRSTP